MNYMINIPQSGQSQLPVSVPVAGGNQRTIFLSSPAHGSCPSNTNMNVNNGSNQNFPMVMQLGANNQPVLLYPNSDNVPIPTQVTEPSTVNSGLGQMVLSPLSPVQKSINMQQNPSPPLSNVNMQPVEAIPNACGIVQSGNIPGNQHNSDPSRIADLISSLQSSGIQIIEAPGNQTPSPNPLNVSVNNSPVSKFPVNKSPVVNFISSLQSAGVQVVENNADSTLSILIPSNTMYGISSSNNVTEQSSMMQYLALETGRYQLMFIFSIN